MDICAIEVLYCIQDGGSLLVAVDEANEHVISVWEWDKGEKGHKITETKVNLSSTVCCK